MIIFYRYAKALDLWSEWYIQQALKKQRFKETWMSSEGSNQTATANRTVERNSIWRQDILVKLYIVFMN